MVATIAAGTTAQYYMSLSGYYTSGGEPKGLWLSVGVKDQVIAGTNVGARDFERLHAGLDRSGRQLLSNDGGKTERVGGYDMTFSAPKSVSLLWGLGDEETRQAIALAQASAVQAAVKMLENNAAFCRSGKGGANREKVKLTVAAFTHGEARPAMHSDGTVFADPDLHTHAVILNLGQKANGRIGALDGKPLFNWKMAAGAAYHLALATELQKLGLPITDIGKNGIFEVAGVAKDLRDYFSARRALIEAELLESGVTSSGAQALAASVTRATRLSKQDLKGEDRHAVWRSKLEALGITANEATLPRVSFKPAKAQIINEAELNSITDQVLLNLTDTESTFGLRQLHAALSSALVGKASAKNSVDELIADLASAGKIVTLDKDLLDHGLFSTPKMIEVEKQVFEIAARFSAIKDKASAPSTETIERLIESSSLSEEQQYAIRAATSGQIITIIEGAPGSGKTTTLLPIKQAWEEAGYRVIGSATAWKIAQMLQNDLSIEARATDSWLARAAAGNQFLDSKTVLIVDEAGLQSSRQMHALLTALQSASAETGNTPKLLLVGDRNQLQSVGAGSGLGIVASATGVERIDTIQRQSQAWAREAIQQIGKGDTTSAIIAWFENKCINWQDGNKATVNALVQAWERAGKEAPHQTRLMIATTNAQVEALSTAARIQMRVEGKIIGKDFVIKAVTPSGQNTTLQLAIGDRVRFLTKAILGEREVINGTEATIAAIRPMANGDTSITAIVGTQKVTFSSNDIADAKGRFRLAYAYASTIYGAQGLTVDRAFALVTPSMNRNSTYVALSRAREKTELFIDRNSIDNAIKQELPLDQRRSYVPGEDAERVSFIGKNLAKSGLKKTTLEFIPATEKESLLLAKPQLENAKQPALSFD